MAGGRFHTDRREPATTHDDHPTLADLATNPGLAAEVDLDDLPQLLGEMERLRAIL